MKLYILLFHYAGPAQLNGEEFNDGTPIFEDSRNPDMNSCRLNQHSGRIINYIFMKRGVRLNFKVVKEVVNELDENFQGIIMFLNDFTSPSDEEIDKFIRMVEAKMRNSDNEA